LDAKSIDDLLYAFKYYFDKANKRYLTGLFKSSAGCAGVSGSLTAAIPTHGLSLLLFPYGVYKWGEGTRSMQQSLECKAKAAVIWQEMQRRRVQLERSTGEHVVWWIKNAGSGATQMACGKVVGTLGGEFLGAVVQAYKACN
jgi:hypothetical protein